MEHFSWYAEQYNALEIAAVPAMPFPFLERSDHTPQQALENGNYMPVGSQDSTVIHETRITNVFNN